MKSAIEREAARIRRMVTAVAYILSLVTVITVPSGYFVTQWRNKAAAMERETAQLADTVARFAYIAGPLWAFQNHRIEQIVAEHRRYNHARGEEKVHRILDAEGDVVVELSDLLTPPVLRAAAPIRHGTAIVGRAVGEESLFPILVETAIAFFTALGLAAAIFVVLRTLPLRVLGTTFARLAEAESALRRSEEQLRLVADSVPVAIAYVDRDLRYVFVNRTAARWLGRPVEQLIGAAVKDVLPPATFAKVLPHLQTALAGRPARFEDEVVYPAVRRRVEAQYLPHVLGDGAVPGFFAFLADVTERAAMERKLRETQKMEAVGELTAGIAHDFNNQLAAIVGNLELLADGVSTRPELLHFAEQALDAAERSAALIKHLLAFARRQILRPDLVDANTAVADLAPMLRRTLGETVKVTVACAENLWKCRVDPGQLENALVNLAINARDAMPNGGEIAISTRNIVLDAAKEPDATPGDYVMVAVADTGAGMAPEMRERAFEPFFTTKEFGQGSGLGLSMVYGFVKQSGGHVRIDSELGHGTIVRLYLPRAEEAMEMSSAGNGPGAHPRGGGETVLVVEDNPQVRESSCSMLKRLGYQPIEAGDGATALSLLDARPDAVVLFTDIVMPGGMNGFELARAARSRRPALKVLFTSGYSDIKELPKEELAAAGDLLAKPFRIGELAVRMARLLGAVKP